MIFVKKRDNFCIPVSQVLQSGFDVGQLGLICMTFCLQELDLKKAEHFAENPETCQPENPPDLKDNSGRFYSFPLFKFC